ncbi:unnamed protein product [Candida verbasci]|uniref:Riboflavin kinase n=1 Tax=Candida verbasci TaxID=1227364 RepID=A0A9W4TRV1_9ASCO|nr:unnamed protein product [Candida verbasci]
MTRPETIIYDSPQSPPYPIKQNATIISGFGRGSSELGIPTANIPITPELNNLECGIYYGWCKLKPNTSKNETEEETVTGKHIIFNYGKFLNSNDLKVLPMVMSIGWNPFYKNRSKAAEVHIINEFNKCKLFYGCEIEFILLGYVRPELNYTTKEALINDINKDIEISKYILEKPNYKKFKDELE